jgi:bile acid-coenzyme A ligase
MTIETGNQDLFAVAESASTEPLPEVTAPHAWGICSSGSTGTPKVIVMKDPGRYIEGSKVAMVVESYGELPQPQRVLVPAPLYHSNGFMATRNLMSGVEFVLLEKFDASRVLDLIERHRITGFVGATPMLQRLVQVPDIDRRDLSSLDWVQQGASPLPVWLGRRWCDLVGPEHFYVSYGASERHGLVCCRGDEWLEHIPTPKWSFWATMEIHCRRAKSAQSTCAGPRAQVRPIGVRTCHPSPPPRTGTSPSAIWVRWMQTATST